jgi:hypothetical protein
MNPKLESRGLTSEGTASFLKRERVPKAARTRAKMSRSWVPFSQWERDYAESRYRREQEEILRDAEKRAARARAKAQRDSAEKAQRREAKKEKQRAEAAAAAEGIREKMKNPPPFTGFRASRFSRNDEEDEDEGAPPPQAAPPPTASRNLNLRILGLTPEEDTPEAIKSAHRRLALQYHPDKNPDPSAVETFKKIQNAYEALSS